MNWDTIWSIINIREPLLVHKMVMGWDDLIIYLVIFVISAALAYATAPKPPKQKAPPGIDPGDISGPIAEVGREIPVVFGTRKVGNPNVVWYGDKKTVPIIKRM